MFSSFLRLFDVQVIQKYCLSFLQETASTSCMGRGTDRQLFLVYYLAESSKIGSL